MNNSDNLEYKKTFGYEKLSPSALDNIMAYAKDYANFLNISKTEREAVSTVSELATQHGFTKADYDTPLAKGDKVFFVNKEKCMALVTLGNNNINDEGIKIIASHLDSPRLDLKQVPLFEKADTAFLKTHYYGGIKKYQWFTIPLAIHGVICLANGNKLKVDIGEKDSDPIFYISDLLPHLSQEQNEKTIAKGFDAEKLNVICGGIKGDADSVKLNILKLLNSTYGLTEEDFLSAELEVVPSLKVRDVGFDRAFLAGYGHDDKVCAYPAFTSLFNQNSNKTSVVFLLDKEEIGSEGVSGAQSRFISDVLDIIIDVYKANPIKVRSKSKCISADVTAGYDPNFADAFEKTNSSLVSHGLAMNKFTGARGKSGANDASCELVAYFRNLFNAKKIVWQTGELGRVDLGGGGTVAKYFANYNIDTVDFGVPVISMHSPYELISKVDLFNTYLGFLAFLND